MNVRMHQYSNVFTFKRFNVPTCQCGITFVSAVILAAVISLSVWSALVLSDIILKSVSVSKTEEEIEMIARGLLNFYRDSDQFPPSLAALKSQPDSAEYEGTASLQSYRRSKWDGPYLQDKYDDDGYTKDAWGMAYVYSYTAGAATCTITSYGLNRSSGGGDDITVTVRADDIIEEKTRKTKMELAYINAQAQELISRYDNAGESLPGGFGIDNLFQSYGADTTGLIGWWKMDEGSWSGTSGEVIDSSGSAKHGTSYNGSSTVSMGKIGRAGKFDGNDDYVAIAGHYLSTATTEGAIEAWFNKTGDSSGTNSAGGIFQNGGSSRPLAYVLNTENIQVYWSGATGMPVGAGDYTNTYSISENKWYHIVFSWVEDHYYLYLNGVLKEDNAFIPSTPVSGDSLIGKYGADNVFKGNLDEVRLWSRSLPSSDVFQEYLRGNYLTDWSYKYDEWENAYVWDGTNEVFYSYGPDRAAGGEDDIYQSQ